MPKKAAKKPKAKSRPGMSSQVSHAPEPDAGVTIRMYCHGLGDCFLLTFPAAEKGESVRVLIDCGILQHAPGEASKMRAVAQDLLESTRRPDGKSYVDLLIVTHEHWDHLAGFAHGKDLFEKIEFGQVWLSWAENPGDPDAKAVKADLGKRRAKLQAALKVAETRMKTAFAANDPSAAPLSQDLTAARDTLAFFGPPDPPSRSALAASKNPASKADRVMTLGETMDWMREKARPKNFRSPGECHALPGAAGVKVYVLGPPRDPNKLRKMNPTGDQGYKLMADRVSLSAAIDDLDKAGLKESPDGPFDKRFRVSPEDAAQDPFFQHYYGFPDDPLGDPGASWRRIDNDWLVGGLSRLALQLDIGVNNTSLALAFELPDGRTLIFPGDAQIGNWLSWDDVKFKDETGKKLTVRSKDLLNRAVFYKVAHHGSQNATRRVGGLEEMKSGDLVVMIPTDEKFALTQSKPHGWKMPAHGVYQALKQFSNNRILRADRDAKELDEIPDSWANDRDRVTFADKTFGDAAGTDKAAATRPLWVEYKVLT